MIVQLENLHKSYGAHPALKGVDLSVKEGSFFALLGPASSGKTTTLRTICGLEKPDQGTVSLFGQRANDAPVQGRGLAMIFQSFALYPHLTVRENLAYPLKQSGVGKGEVTRRVGEIADLLRISHRLDNPSDRLSGGEQQRVAIGRALIREPRILLLDEPLTNLDAKLRDEMRVEFKRLHRELGITMIYATPDQLEATTMAEEIAVISDGQIVQVGDAASIYSAPNSTLVASLIGSPAINLINGTRANDNVSLGFTDIPCHSDVPQVTCGIRPQDLFVDPNGPFAARVSLVEPLGDYAVMTVRTLEANEEKSLRMVLSGSSMRRVRENDQLRLNFDPARVLFFNSETGCTLTV